MEDVFKRNINYLRLSVTDRCNLRCIYCMPESGITKLCHKDMLSVEEMVEIVSAAAKCGITKVRLTGGEPLVHRGIIDICRNISSLADIKELCITTNGVMLTAFAQELKEAGVDRLNISIDTLNGDKYRRITRNGDIDTVFKGIEAAEKAGFKNIKLNTVLMGGINDDEIKDFVNLTLHKPWEVRFIELMPMGECINWPDERFVSAQEVLRRCPELKSTDISGVAQRYRIDGAKGMVGIISPVSHSFCDECNRIRVTSEGWLKPCLHSGDEIKLKGLHGEELTNAIMHGICLKPRKHSLSSDKSLSHRNMNQIGG